MRWPLTLVLCTMLLTLACSVVLTVVHARAAGVGGRAPQAAAIYWFAPPTAERLACMHPWPDTPACPAATRAAREGA